MTPIGPEFGEFWHGFAIEHVLSRSVRDRAAMLDATAGSDPGAPYAAPMPLWPFLDEVSAEPGRLRIAFTRQPLFGRGAVPADCIAGLEDTARLIESMGHRVNEATPPLDQEACAVAFATVIAAETRAEIEHQAQLKQRRPHRRDFEPATYTIGLLGRAISGAAYAGALQPSVAKQRLMRIVDALNAGWLMNALGAVKLQAAKTFEYIPLTPLFNVTGQPAMPVPLHWSAAGLPIGMQFAARLGEDAMLFRLAGQLERARPWFDRRPPGY